MTSPAAGSDPEIVVATSNPHKAAEIRAVLEPLGIAVRGLDEVLENPGPEPDEDGTTFAENARIKALHHARVTTRLCLADDSGLEVDALDGAPGIRSARYAGTGDDRRSRDEANNAKLLAALADVPDERRRARFVCAMCLAAPDGRVLEETRGTFEGAIVREPRGDHGFGYDPLLVVAGLDRTSAELDPEEKNRRSHRGQAARAMAERLSARLGR